ncbi:alpha/beta fold hydrolase [Subtercola frigoramans]|uniref:2-hydroxy-6-oxonona-2,4-dienedioate hydrolase n=1 Tax=Subtercola frigoramans TaxID=120298 RepID=A0ABS2L977_9MICO|nr:alpha/beta hydrolase [Subtercola frigoramans]MBM7473637.1 2-hydroxy-6-oxonona-2,4-dienedioate hydrolase [Subtercola frigoramans]
MIGMIGTSETESERLISVSSGNIHYHDVGSGPAVVLLHGSGPGATAWSNFGANIAALSARFRVVAIDMPGWGQSHPARVRERDHVATLIEVLDALEIERTAVVGNSMGAVTSLAFAARHPDRVTHVVTMGAAMVGQRMMFSAGDGPSEGLKVLFAAYRDPSPENMKRLVDVMTFDSSGASDEVARERSRNALRFATHRENFVADLAEGLPIVSKPASYEEIASISVPVLLIHGRDDRVLSMENSLRLVSVIQDSRLVVINRCGHWAQLEHAAEFNRIVTSFIAHDE